MKALELSVLPGEFAICRLDPADPIPDWAMAGEWFAITRTSRELSVVTRQDRVPADVRSVPGWRCLEVQGPLEFSEVGIIASLAGPLAGSGISISVIATHDTDYLMVRENDLDLALETLTRAGHRVGKPLSPRAPGNARK